MFCPRNAFHCATKKPKTKSVWGFVPHPTGEGYDAPQTLYRLGMGIDQTPRPLRRLDYWRAPSIFSASQSLYELCEPGFFATLLTSVCANYG